MRKGGSVCYLYRDQPSLNRFISPGTIVPSPGNPQSLNRYSYALNNALKYTDPTGHSPSCGYGGGSCEEGGGPLWPVEIKQAPSDALDNVAAVTEGIASVLFEPADWVITGRDCLTGHCSPLMLLGLLPLIPSSLAGRADDAVDVLRTAHKTSDIGRMTTQQAAKEVVKKTGTKAIVIGENMRDRVAPYAKSIGADWYKPRSKIPENWMKNNKRWLREQMKRGVEIIDIGIDVARSVRSEYYAAEKKLLEKMNYPVRRPYK